MKVNMKLVYRLFVLELGGIGGVVVDVIEKFQRNKEKECSSWQQSSQIFTKEKEICKTLITEETSA